MDLFTLCIKSMTQAFRFLSEWIKDEKMI